MIDEICQLNHLSEEDIIYPDKRFYSRKGLWYNDSTADGICRDEKYVRALCCTEIIPYLS